MDNSISRDEFQTAQLRLHARVDEIKESSIRTEESAHTIKISVDKLYEVMFGNGKPGIVTQVSNVFIHLKLQYALIFLGITGIASTCAFVIKTYLVK